MKRKYELMKKKGKLVCLSLSISVCLAASQRILQLVLQLDGARQAGLLFKVHSISLYFRLTHRVTNNS